MPEDLSIIPFTSPKIQFQPGKRGGGWHGFSEAPCSLVPQKCGALSQDTGLLERSLDHDKQWGAVQGGLAKPELYNCLTVSLKCQGEVPGGSLLTGG